MMKKLLAMIIFGAILTAGACGAGKTGASQASRAEQNQQVYEVYRQYMEAMNQQRRQAGLPPEAVKSYEEFRRSPGTE
jgi:type II secretory pathway pseudopilin PulG